MNTSTGVSGNGPVTKPAPLHPYSHVIREIEGRKYFSLPALDGDRLRRMPYCTRVLLEAAVRNCDNFEVRQEDVNRLLDWRISATQQKEIAFKPSRVLLQDFTGVPAIVDLAVMRDAMRALGASPDLVNPLIPTDLVIDHSVIVDISGRPDAREKNEAIEFKRNWERFAFLKWGQSAFRNLTVTPPGTGIVHQVNLEYLARVVFEEQGLLYPDSVVGTDSHTPMVDGAGVLGWGVGGIEAEATMLGQPIGMVVPPVVGFELAGELPAGCTTTDLVLKVAQMLRGRKVVGKFVEFYGLGTDLLSVPDRATISNMSPEFGATAAFFPVDSQTFEYLRTTGRDSTKLDLAEKYLKAAGLFRDPSLQHLVEYSEEPLRLDLGSLVPSVAGPKRPHDYLPMGDLAKDFSTWLSAPVGFRGFGLETASRPPVTVSLNGQSYQINHGAVVIAAITSCTNTSNPVVMIWAGLLARNAVAKGMKPPAYVKCSLSPGSHVVHEYFKSAGLLEELERLGFYLCGFGCQTCIGNSGDIDSQLGDAVLKEDLVVAAVLSGNRNFEGRIHPLTRANFLMSPPLVLAYALAGRVDIDFEKEPIANGVYLRDIWPSRSEVDAVIVKHVKPEMFAKVYAHLLEGSEIWQTTPVPKGDIYAWSAESTYIHRPPYFDGMGMEPEEVLDVEKAYCLLLLGDSITTDHISPAGKIALDSPASDYLQMRGVKPTDFNSYGSRRGNDEVMVRGTFANIRLVNKLVPKTGPITVHMPSGDVQPVYTVAMRYRNAGIPSIIIAGNEYGSGSSRDWAAKGPMLQGVRAVIARGYERIHRSNLVGMGIVPLQFKEGQSAESLGLTGHERFSFAVRALRVGGDVAVDVFDKDGKEKKSSFIVTCRIDAPVELEYYYHGGILKYVLRKMARGSGVRA